MWVSCVTQRETALHVYPDVDRACVNVRVI